MIINGKNAILGRLAAVVAKRLLEGDKIEIVNAEQVIVTGDPKSILNHYKAKRRRGSPHHGPFFPCSPDKILRRTIRGMLPYKKPKGRKALARLKVHNNIPKDLKNEKFETVAVKDIESNFIRLKDISRRL